MQDNIKTVAITGANGFIGSRVCRLLAASGYAIRIICRASSDLSLLEDIPYSKVYADITNPNSLAPAIENADYIVHLAGLVKAKKDEMYFKVNQEGTLNLLNAVKNNNLSLKRFVLVSSTAAFGPSFGKPRLEIDSPKPLTAYGSSKLAGEEAAEPFKEIIPITVLRPPGVYGPGDKAILPLFETVNKGFRPYMGGGNNLIQMVYVDDLTRAIMMAMESPSGIGEAYIIADSEAHTIREMLNIIGGLLEKKGIGLTIPMPLLKLIAFGSEVFFRSIGCTPHFSREKVKELTADWEFDVSKAKKDLNFETEIGFRDGARITIDWYRKKGWLK